MNRRVLTALIVIATGLATAAHAQNMPTVLPNDYVLKDILNQQRVEAAIGAPPVSAGPGPRAPGRAAKVGRPATATTGYRSSPAVSQSVRRQFADWLGRRTSPEEGRRVAQLLEREDPVANWSRLVAGDGLRPGDVADALTAYWLLNWAMANSADGDRVQVQGVRDQVRTIMAADTAFARLDEPGRQTFAETLMLNFLIQHAAYGDAVKRGDQVVLKRLGDAAVARFRTELNVDLRRLRLTARGFAPA